MTLDEALAGKEIPREIRESLAPIDIHYVSFEGNRCEGQLVVHKEFAEEIRQIFHILFEKRFPIEKMVPIVAYGWDDETSMADNNSSAFNYRFIALTNRLSNHAYGCAIDINPMQNPSVQRDGIVVPHGALYDPAQPGTITADIASIFKSHGWKWGGDWIEQKDWQHFEKH